MKYDPRHVEDLRRITNRIAQLDGMLRTLRLGNRHIELARKRLILNGTARGVGGADNKDFKSMQVSAPAPPMPRPVSHSGATP